MGVKNSPRVSVSVSYTAVALMNPFFTRLFCAAAAAACVARDAIEMDGSPLHQFHRKLIRHMYVE